jgi:hypothetical protein
MDRVGADFFQVIADIAAKLGAHAVRSRSPSARRAPSPA